MTRHLTTLATLTILALALTGCAKSSVGDFFSRGFAAPPSASEVGDDGAAMPEAPAMAAPFGGIDDVTYAAKLWAVMGDDDLVGSDAIVTYPYQGTQPHGELLEIMTATSTVDGFTSTLISKKNYIGDGITALDVSNNPDAYLDSVTVMFQREVGYDSDNADWFWAKYFPDGTVMTNPMGMHLAGRVAKGMDAGCIACHIAAPGGDYVFSHDRLAPVLTN